MSINRYGTINEYKSEGEYVNTIGSDGGSDQKIKIYINDEIIVKW